MTPMMQILTLSFVLSTDAAAAPQPPPPGLTPPPKLVEYGFGERNFGCGSFDNYVVDFQWPNSTHREFVETPSNNTSRRFFYYDDLYAVIRLTSGDDTVAYLLFFNSTVPQPAFFARIPRGEPMLFYSRAEFTEVHRLISTRPVGQVRITRWGDGPDPKNPFGPGSTQRAALVLTRTMPSCQ